MKVKEMLAGIEIELQELEIALKQVLDSQEKIVADASAHLLSSAGKRLRPALFFLCAKLTRDNLEEYIPVAVAIELIHSATLVHDDVVDNSNFRRGLPSVNSRWGNQVSVLLGDYLFARAFALLTDYGSLLLINLMSRVVENMSEGEIQQLYEVCTPDLSQEDYLDRVKKKTALFFSSSCQSAGVVTGAGDLEVLALKNYGYNLGMAFQIIDDLLDFKGKESEVGKPVGNDLRQGIVTLPVIYMLDVSDRGEYFKDRIRNREIDPDLVEQVVHEIIRSGSHERAYEMAEGYIDQAIKELAVFPGSPYKRTLEYLARFVLVRHY